MMREVRKVARTKPMLKGWTQERFAQEVAQELGIELGDHDQAMARSPVRQERLAEQSEKAPAEED
jgi:sulfite reductase beta subunit-like hemoprotein